MGGEAYLAPRLAWLSTRDLVQTYQTGATDNELLRSTTYVERIGNLVKRHASIRPVLVI